MSFTVDSSHQALFGGDFYAQVKITVTKDAKANTFKVKVDGLRGYSKYEWNFGQRVQMWLGTSSSGAGKVNLTDTYVSIPSSGSDSYRGWIPTSGYSATCSITKTYQGNSDGTCPDVWLYFRDYNPSVTWVSNGIKLSVDVSYKNNIKTLIQDDVGTNDRSAPTITVESTGLTSTSVSWKATSNVSCNKWEYSLDGAAYVTYSNSDTTTASKTVTGLKSGNHTIKVRGTKTSNGVTGVSSSVSYDCNVPVISGFTITPSGASTVKASFSCNYSFQYMIKKPGDASWPSTWSSTVAANTVTTTSSMSVPNTNGIYYIRVRRTSDADLTAETSATCDMRIPIIRQFSVTPSSNTTAVAVFSANYDFNYTITCPDGTRVPASGYSSDCSAESVQSVSVKGLTGIYILNVYRKTSAYLSATQSTSNDNDAPVISTFAMTPTGPTTANSTILVDKDFQYRIKRPSGNYSNWTSTITGGVEIHPTLETESVSGVYTLEVRRPTSYNLTASKTTSCDCRLPDITFLTLRPQSVNTATLSVSSSYDCYWYVYDKDSNTLMNTTPFGPSTSLNEQIVNVKSNASKQYIVRGCRKDYLQLTVQREVNCDTAMPILNFDSLTTQANMVYFTVSANSSSGLCKDWKVVFTDIFDNETVYALPAQESSSISEVFSGLDVGREYNVTVYATRVSNNIVGSAQYSSAIQLTGTVRIKVGNETKCSSVYIFNGGKWKLALPYIYDGTQWKLGQ